MHEILSCIPDVPFRVGAKRGVVEGSWFNFKIQVPYRNVSVKVKDCGSVKSSLCRSSELSSAVSPVG